MLYACDGTWWDHYIEDVKENYKGELWTQDERAAKQYKLNFIKSQPGNGFSTDKSYIQQGETSGYQAINLAYHFGAQLVVLLGYDMSHNGQMRWHGLHPQPLGNAGQYGLFAKNFDQMNPPMKVINASRKTVLKSFERMKLDDVIQQFK